MNKKSEPNPSAPSDVKRLESLGAHAERSQAERGRAEEERKKATVLLVESAAKSASRVLVVALRVRRHDEQQRNKLGCSAVQVELFQPAAKGQLMESRAQEGSGAEKLCEQLEKWLAPWDNEMVEMKVELAPKKLYAMIPLNELAAKLAVALMGAPAARAWMAEREAQELDLVLSPSQRPGVQGPRL